MKMKIGVDVYISKDEIHLLLTRNVATVVTTYGEFFSIKKIGVPPNFFFNAIKQFLQITDDQFNSKEVDSDHQIIGYATFADLYKKTSLITLRIEEKKIKVFNAKKVKRWYEFEPIDPVEGYDLTDDGIKSLSEKLVEVLRTD